MGKIGELREASNNELGKVRINRENETRIKPDLSIKDDITSLDYRISLVKDNLNKSNLTKEERESLNILLLELHNEKVRLSIQEREIEQQEEVR